MYVILTCPESPGKATTLEAERSSVFCFFRNNRESGKWHKASLTDPLLAGQECFGFLESVTILLDERRNRTLVPSQWNQSSILPFVMTLSATCELVRQALSKQVIHLCSSHLGVSQHRDVHTPIIIIVVRVLS